ncbi:MAG: succinate dehydrogenase assembly factor 2 [Pseudomonadota bacterium]
MTSDRTNAETSRDPLELRRRRALFRAMHRGTKEMDWMLGRYAKAELDGMDDAALTTFEQLLANSDPDINSWLIRPELLENLAFGPLIATIRAFHGLDDMPDATPSQDTAS